MTTFVTFSNILPDPAHPITDAGDYSLAGSPGPGFAALGFQSVRDSQVSRTISGRGIQRDLGSQHWEFTISYNPMFRDQFDPIDSFLEARNSRTNPFYVVLPQYSKPKNSTFATFAAANVMVVSGTPVAGSSTLLVGCIATTPAGTPKPGDMFTITDPADFNHQKVYKVGRVETPAYYQAGTTVPGTNYFRIHIAPPLQRTILTANSVVNFINPLFRVITKSDVQEHSLSTDNLYSFSLACEEIQP